MQHPVNPKSTAKAIIQHPGRLRDMGGVVLPPGTPRIPEEALDRPYLGSEELPEPLEENSPISVRLSDILLLYIDDVVHHHENFWYKSRADFIRHAAIELALAYYKQDEAAKRGEPQRWREIVHVIERTAEFKRQTALLLAREAQESHVRVVERALVKAIRQGDYREIDRQLEFLAGQAKAVDPTMPDVWAVDLSEILANSATIERAINALVREWKLSDKSKEQRAADEWDAWWENMKRHRRARGRSQRQEEESDA